MERTYPTIEALASAIDALDTLLAHVRREHVTPVPELKEAALHLKEAAYYLHSGAKTICQIAQESTNTHGPINPVVNSRGASQQLTVTHINAGEATATNAVPLPMQPLHPEWNP